MENTNYNNNQTDQVFISFRGRDERYTFLSHLKQKLIDGKVNVFTDDNATGQPLESLFEHIRNSRIVIVIFSKNYAESHWCLDELVEIQKCIETKKLDAVIPIFHKVKVSSVKKQSGKFGEKFLALQNSLLAKEGITKDDINSRIESWKKALKAVTGTMGLTYTKNIPEAEFVEKIVKKVKIYLPKIEAEEGSNETIERSQVKQSNLIVFNVNQLNVNNYQLHVSKSLEALSLGRWNPEGYNMSVDMMKPLSRDHRRTNSDLDHRDQFGPFPFEAIMVQKQVENQRSIDNILQKQYRTGTTCISSLRYYFKLCLCLNDSEQKMIQSNR